MADRPAPHTRWPVRLWLVRHGESAGNVARDLAHQNQTFRIEIAAGRDVDVPLSDRGREQAHALANFFFGKPTDERPEVLLSSPYLRARETAQAVAEATGLAGGGAFQCADERLREREFGILDRLTSDGIHELYPEQAALRTSIGKFYHRPPGGESWCDVILRLRSALDTLSLHHAGRRVLIVGHQVVILCFRYLLEDLSEAQILAIDAAGDVANCSVTEYALNPASGELSLLNYNDVAHLEKKSVPITTKPDLPAAPR